MTQLLRARPRRIALPSGKMVSPEHYFVRTGKTPQGLARQRAKTLEARFLGRKWFDIAKTGRAKRGRVKLPLPGFRQRLYGGNLPKAEREEIGKQIRFAMNVFAGHLDQAEKKRVLQQVGRSITGRSLSVNAALREKTKGSDLRKMWTQGRELVSYLKETGEIYPAIMQDTTGRTYFAKGWTSDRPSLAAPLHEAVHILQRMRVIKIDVPFAEAADRLYALEQGILRVNPSIKSPTIEELNRKPAPEKDLPGSFEEPDWATEIGKRIGTWVFLNLPREKRWRYIRMRCMGRSHEQAIHALKWRGKNQKPTQSIERLALQVARPNPH